MELTFIKILEGKNEGNSPLAKSSLLQLLISQFPPRTQIEQFNFPPLCNSMQFF